MVNYESGEFMLLNDVAFKEMFERKERILYSEYLMECYLGFPTGSLRGKVEVLLDETLKKNYLDEHGMTLDVVLLYNNVIYNFEPSVFFDRTALNKVLAYNGKIFSSELSHGESYRDMKRVEQVVLIHQSKIALEKTLLSRNVFRNKGYILSEMQRVHIIRVDMVGKDDYNIDERLKELICYIGASNKKEREKIAKKGSKQIMKLNEELNKACKSFKVPPGYDRIEFRYAQGYEAGEESGIERGILKNQEDTARNMLSEDFDVSMISKITGLSEKSIKNLQKENHEASLVL